MKHGLSIDVEDYYQILYQDYFQIKTAPSLEVEQNTNRLLDMLSKYKVQATFFVLGNVAHQYPSLIKRIVLEGHEIGAHGYEHKYIFKMKPDEFREEIKRAKGEIEDLSGAQVIGHRAPAFSITKGVFWAVDILLELGFLYDSSIYPIQGKRYGIGDSIKTVYRWPNGLHEIPLSCLEILGKKIPVAGGGYIRHFPYWCTQFALSRLEKLKRPAAVYMHPYEFEDSYPEIDSPNKPIPMKLRIHTFLQAHNRGKKQWGKLTKLLSDFQFVPLKNLLKS
jgi:polysaccharide deacetylase family protein (PEP-CTERM system associated)